MFSQDKLPSISLKKGRRMYGYIHEIPTRIEPYK